MARKASIKKNLKIKSLIESYKLKRQKLKEQIYNKNLPLEERFHLITQLAELPRNSSKSRWRNRCELTGRPRAYYRRFGLSRNKLRELASKGQIAGLIKASW